MDPERVDRSSKLDGTGRGPRNAGSRWSLFAGAGALLLLIAVIVAFQVGGCSSAPKAYDPRAQDQMRLLEDFLEQHRDRYPKITVHEGSSGNAYLIGSVDSSDDFRRLTAELQRQFGDEVAHEMTYRVEFPITVGDGMTPPSP